MNLEQLERSLVSWENKKALFKEIKKNEMLREKIKRMSDGERGKIFEEGRRNVENLGMKNEEIKEKNLKEMDGEIRERALWKLKKQY